MNEIKNEVNTGDILNQVKSLLSDSVVNRISKSVNADTGNQSDFVDNDTDTENDILATDTGTDVDTDTGEDDNDKPIVKRGEVGFKDIDSVINCSVDCTIADFFGILRDLGFNEDDEVFATYGDDEVMTKNIADELEFISGIDTDLLKRRFENLVEYSPRNITVARYLACCKRLGIDADSARVF